MTPKEGIEQYLLPLLDELYAAARRLARNQALAEDLVQETYLKALRAWPREPIKEPRAWAHRILINTFLNHRRKYSRETLTDQVEETAGPEKSEPESHAREAGAVDWKSLYEKIPDDELRKAIDELSDEHKLVLLMVNLGGLSLPEVAEELKVPVGTVMSRLFRARNILKGKLHDRAVERRWE